MLRHGSAADDLCVSVRVMLMGGKVTNSFNTNNSTKHFDILLCATSAQPPKASTTVSPSAELFSPQFVCRSNMISSSLRSLASGMVASAGRAGPARGHYMARSSSRANAVLGATTFRKRLYHDNIVDHYENPRNVGTSILAC